MYEASVAIWRQFFVTQYYLTPDTSELAPPITPAR